MRNAFITFHLHKQQADSHPINIRIMLFVYICYFHCVF